MKIKYGTSRVVVLLPFLGLALKFPRVYTIMMLRNLYFGYIKRRFWKGLFLFLTSKGLGSFSYFMLNGIGSNLSEFWFYLKTRNKFAWPTYFSFFGLVNIQRLGTNPNFWDINQIYFIISNVAGRDVKDGHTFTESNNYILDGC